MNALPLARNAAICSVTLLGISLGLQNSEAHAEESNRNQVRAGVAAGGWHPVWGVTINEAEYLKASASIYAGNPAAYFSNYLDRTIEKVVANSPNVGRQALEAAIVRAFQGRQMVNIGDVGVKAGIVSYRRWQTVSAHVPDGTERYKLKGPFGTWTYAWRPKMKLVEKRIPLPNHHQPYVAFRLSRPGGGGGHGGGTVPQTRIWIENPTSLNVHYKMNGQAFTILGGKSRWHSVNSGGQFNVEFDWNFADGYQRRAYRLTPGSRNYFQVRGPAIDLLKR